MNPPSAPALEAYPADSGSSICGIGVGLDRPGFFPRGPDRTSSAGVRQQPGGLVGDAKLVLQLQRRHAAGMGRHEIGGPKPRRQRQPG